MVLGTKLLGRPVLGTKPWGKLVQDTTLWGRRGWDRQDMHWAGIQGILPPPRMTHRQRNRTCQPYTWRSVSVRRAVGRSRIPSLFHHHSSLAGWSHCTTLHLWQRRRTNGVLVPIIQHFQSILTFLSRDPSSHSVAAHLNNPLNPSTRILVPFWTCCNTHASITAIIDITTASSAYWITWWLLFSYR